MLVTFVLDRAGLVASIRVVAIYAERLKQRTHEVLVVSIPPDQPTLRKQMKSLLKGQGRISVPKTQLTHFDPVLTN